MVIALAATDLAQDVNIGHKVHLNTALAFTLAVLTPAARDVERKTPCFVTTLTRFRQHGIEIADISEDTCIGCRIGTWRPSNRRLINANHLINVLRPGNGFVSSGLFPRSIELAGQGFVQNVVYQGGFAGAGNPGDHCNDAERKSNVYAAQVVGPRSENGDCFTVGCAWLFTRGNTLCAGDVLAGQRV